ncbi:MAG: helix-turn-helix domain-containing protein [Gammaproteobacteria bacterium]
MSIKKKSTPKSDKTLKIIEKILGKKPTLGDYLYALREGDEKNQSDFAELLGVSRQYLCDVEKGRRVVSAKAAASFAEKLGFPPEVFIQLALQDELNQAGLKYNIELKACYVN